MCVFFKRRFYDDFMWTLCGCHGDFTCFFVILCGFMVISW